MWAYFWCTAHGPRGMFLFFSYGGLNGDLVGPLTLPSIVM